MLSNSTRKRPNRLPAWIWMVPFLGLFISASSGQTVPALESQANKMFELKFSAAPIDQIMEIYGEISGRTIIKSPQANATISIRSKTEFTGTEMLEVFESLLAMNGFAVVPLGEKFIKVVPTAEVRKRGLEFGLTHPQKPFKEIDQVISQVVELKHLEIAEIQPILDVIKSPFGMLQPLERNNSFLITDTAQNLNRIVEILKYLDQPITITEDVFVREIVNAPASEIASKLQELIAESQQEEQQRRSSRTAATTSAPAATANRVAPPGVIRARGAPPGTPTPATQGATDLANRGIVQGKVKIVADDRTGILFIISRPENFEFFDKIINLLDRPIDPEFVVRVIAMEYAEATDISGILNDFIGAQGDATATPNVGQEQEDAVNLRDFVARQAQERQAQAAPQAAGEGPTDVGSLSSNTRILADERTNSLLLMGRKNDINALKEIIDQLDIMLGQVLIEAVILEVLLDNDLAHGVDWLQRSYTVFNEEVVGPQGGIAVRQPVFSFGGGQNNSGRESFIGGNEIIRSSPIGSALTYYATFHDLNIDAVITLAASSSDTRILSTPVILTADNTEARIIVGEERPVVSTTQTTTAGSFRSSYEYRNIGIQLTVTPRINPQRFVVMQITQTADDVGGEVTIDGNQIPIITRREMTAEVAVDSRETIILGGLVRNSKRDSESKVPFVGDIPLVGNLFTSKTKSDERTELMVLLTPYVLMTPEEVSAETKRLHSATQLDRTNWDRGWTDSKLARPSKEELKVKKDFEKEIKRIRKKNKLEDTMNKTTQAAPAAGLSPDIVISAPSAEPEMGSVVEKSLNPSEITAQENAEAAEAEQAAKSAAARAAAAPKAEIESVAEGVEVLIVPALADDTEATLAPPPVPVPEAKDEVDSAVEDVLDGLLNDAAEEPEPVPLPNVTPEGATLRPSPPPAPIRRTPAPPPTLPAPIPVPSLPAAVPTPPAAKTPPPRPRQNATSTREMSPEISSMLNKLLKKSEEEDETEEPDSSGSQDNDPAPSISPDAESGSVTPAEPAKKGLFGRLFASKTKPAPAASLVPGLDQPAPASRPDLDQEKDEELAALRKELKDQRIAQERQAERLEKQLQSQLEEQRVAQAKETRRLEKLLAIQREAAEAREREVQKERDMLLANEAAEKEAALKELENARKEQAKLEAKAEREKQARIEAAAKAEQDRIEREDAQLRAEALARQEVEAKKQRDAELAAKRAEEMRKTEEVLVRKAAEKEAKRLAKLEAEAAKKQAVEVAEQNVSAADAKPGILAGWFKGGEKPSEPELAAVAVVEPRPVSSNELRRRMEAEAQKRLDEDRKRAERIRRELMEKYSSAPKKKSGFSLFGGRKERVASEQASPATRTTTSVTEAGHSGGALLAPISR